MITINNENSKYNIFAVLLLIVLLALLSPFKNMLLLTFFISFLVNELQEYIYSLVLKHTDKKLNKKILTITIFFICLAVATFVCINYIPSLIGELLSIKDELFSFIEDNNINGFSQYFDTSYYMTYIKDNMDTTFKTVLEVKDCTVTVLYAILLSFLFLISKDELKVFNLKFEKSKISYLYNFYKKLANIFIQSFGKVIQVQLVISVINCVLSIIGLSFLGFPQPLALGFMILVLSLIPVFGVVISLVPLTVIAFKIGGLKKIVEVIILICILHLLESYFINPKLMSNKTHLPIFMTFLVLIISEECLGVWGLIIGIPLFTFFLEIIKNETDNNELEIKDNSKENNNKQ